MKWPIAGGAMGERIRQFDWSSTSLGPLSEWPQSLKTAVDVMLAAAQPVLVAWGDEHVLLFNEHYLPILGDKQSWALGKTFEQVWSEVWDEYHPLLDAVRAGEAYFFKNRLVELVGRTPGWFTFSFIPLRDETGSVRGLLNVSSETTEQVMADKALVDAMDEGFAIFDTVFDAQRQPCDFRWIATNPAFESQTGRSDTVGRTLKEVLPQLEAEWFERFSRVVKTGEGVRFTQESASEGKWYDCYAFRYGADDSTRLGLLFRDITKARQAEQALLDASRRKDEFLAMLAHELRNPLAPIAAGASLLKLASGVPDSVKKTGEVIARQVRHMTGLVDDLLDVARVTRGQVNLHLATLDVHQIALDAIEQVRPLMEARRHNVALTASTHAVAVRGDSKRLVQTFANLLANAAKFTPDGGDIVVTVEVRTDTVDVAVSDTGQGMPPELLNQCFELFVQAKRTAERSAAGLGIGLALVRSLVELHGGSVRAESDGIGKGSKITVTLPRALTLEEERDQTESRGDGRAQADRRLKVLVVDDNKDAATMLALLIEALGHDTAVEHDPRRALQALREDDLPHVCFLDIGLPEMDGHEMARTIRARLGNGRPKLVAVTGYGQPSDRDKALASGFDEHFAKPISEEKLSELLRSL